MASPSIGVSKKRNGLFAGGVLARLDQSERVVVAAVCYRKRNDRTLEFLLVRTGNGRWTFPKGGVDDDPTRAAAAAREAYEEAGAIGRVEEEAFAKYIHSKNDGHTHLVHAHLFRVKHVSGGSEGHRCPTWFSAENAKRRLREGRMASFGSELERIVDAAVRIAL